MQPGLVVMHDSKLFGNLSASLFRGAVGKQEAKQRPKQEIKNPSVPHTRKNSQAMTRLKMK